MLSTPNEHLHKIIRVQLGHSLILISSITIHMYMVMCKPVYEAEWQENFVC